MEYFNEKGEIRATLLDEEAKTLADSLVVLQKERDGSVRRNRQGKVLLDAKKTLNSAQLRKFYNDFKQLEKKVAKQDFEKVKPLIKMVKSKASYASNPSNQKIPPQFKQFLIENVDSINSKGEFEVFMLHFEAIVGFYYGMEGVRSD
ncbi:MAG: type III-A CRISPR-associated protein Csm2 [Thermodesulfobacteriota bacterium]|nr:type III-A CRISPR-associated protein Csm2 [Thermodesulfobacteriota bacterium]